MKGTVKTTFYATVRSEIQVQNAFGQFRRMAMNDEEFTLLISEAFESYNVCAFGVASAWYQDASSPSVECAVNDFVAEISPISRYDTTTPNDSLRAPQQRLVLDPEGGPAVYSPGDPYRMETSIKHGPVPFHMDGCQGIRIEGWTGLLPSSSGISVGDYIFISFYIVVEQKEKYGSESSGRVIDEDEFNEFNVY